MVRLTLEELKRRVDQLYETLGGQHTVVFTSQSKSGKRSYLKMLQASYDLDHPDIDCKIEMKELSIAEALKSMSKQK